MLSLRHYAAAATIALACSLPGCVAPGPQVPATATLMTQGNHGPVSFRTDQPGRVYIKDDSNGVTLYSSEVNRGQLVEVNPVEDVIRVDGRDVSFYAMDNDHRFQIYFEPQPHADVVRYRVEKESVERRVEPADRVIERKTEIRTTDPLDRPVERKITETEIKRDPIDGTIEKKTTERQIER